MKKRLGLWKKIFRLSVFVSVFAGAVFLTGCKRKEGSPEDFSKELLQDAKEEIKAMATAPGDEKKGFETEGSGSEKSETEGLGNKEPEPEAVNIPLDDYDAWRELLKENTCSQEFNQALLQFSYESASKVLAGGEGNGNFSPLSLYYVLALAENGAENETAQELLDVLGMEDTDALAEECGKLYRQMYYREQRLKEEYKQYGDGDFQSTIKLRNSLWLSDAFTFHPSYQERAARDFYASLHPVDFTQPEAGEAMGQWISDQTNGVLAPSISVNPRTALSMINTLYFYGSWNTKFSEERTKTDEFTLADKTKVECPMMNREEEMGMFYRGDGYTLSLLYTNNDCRMVILLPDRDRTAQEFLQSKDALEKSLGNVGKFGEDVWTSGKVIWKLPKFSFGSSYDLIESLSKMGLEKMFDEENADFSGISDETLWVSQVIQESHIGVDEEGIEGAAYTMLAVSGAGMPREEEVAEMICDRPFIYGIQDVHSGAWFFIGICQNPGLH